ncbi:MAG: hypothetical protein ABI390_09655, partial [Daejeonella sp.]
MSSFYKIRPFKPFLLVFAILILSFNQQTQAQQKKISDFIIFSGNPAFSTNIKNDQTSGTIISSGADVRNGNIGSYHMVTTTGSLNVIGNIFSGGNADLSSRNNIDGSIYIYNLQNQSTNNLVAGS